MNDQAPVASIERKPLTRRAFLSSSIMLAVGSEALLTACTRVETDTNKPEGGKEFQPLTFLTPIPLTSLTFAPEILAEAAGYFADQNLNVKFELTRGSGQAIPLILAGQATLTRISQIEGMKAAANHDAPLVNVGMIFKESTIRFVSSARDPLRKPIDFLGKTIGIPSEGGSSAMELDLFLAVSGVDGRRVRRQVVGLTPSVFDLVKQGRLAGYAVSIDTAKILERQQPDSIALNPGEFMSSGGQFYVTSRDNLIKNKETIRKFLNAIRNALEFMINDDGFDRTLNTLREKHSFDALNDTAIAKESLREYVRVWTSGGRENVLLTLSDRWAAAYQELVDAELAAAGANPEKWFTNEFIKQDAQ